MRRPVRKLNLLDESPRRGSSVARREFSLDVCSRNFSRSWYFYHDCCKAKVALPATFQLRRSVAMGPAAAAVGDAILVAALTARSYFS